MCDPSQNLCTHGGIEVFYVHVLVVGEGGPGGNCCAHGGQALILKIKNCFNTGVMNYNIPSIL